MPLKQLTVHRLQAIKGSSIEYILVEVDEDATVEQLAALVKRRWLEETATGTPPAWLTTLRSNSSNDDEKWAVKILTKSGRPLQSEHTLKACAAEPEQPSHGFWGDCANSQDFQHGGVSAVPLPLLGQ